MQTTNTLSGTAVADARLVRQFRNGVNWFYWIAGLSMINSLIWWLGGGWTFLAGLAVTQISDGFFSGWGEALGGSGRIVAAVVAVVASLLVSGIFALFGYLASQGKIWVFCLGMAIYAVDAVICLVFRAIPTFLFHIFALFGLLWGLIGLARLRALAARISAA